MKVVVPMAGRGSRFQKLADERVEFRKPKPLIDVGGKPMIAWALASLPFLDLPNKKARTKMKVTPKDLIFIVLEEHQHQYNITKLLQDIFSKDITTILVPQVTRGAAETALAAKKYINIPEDVLISDSDHFFDGSVLYKTIMQKDNETMGIIPVFKPPDDEVKWSYTLFDKRYTALAVAEKDPVLAAKGAYANIGAYYFSYGNLFVNEAEEMIRQNDIYGPQGKQEFFIAPMYQRLIQKKHKVKAAIVPDMWGLGTPKDLEFFLSHYKNK